MQLLQTLFGELVESKARQYKPNHRLVCLALTGSRSLKKVPRASIPEQLRPAVLAAATSSLKGGENSTPEEEFSSGETLVDAPAVSTLLMDDDMLPVTATGPDLADSPFEDKENLPPTEDEKLHNTPEPAIERLESLSPSRANKRKRSPSPAEKVTSEQLSVNRSSSAPVNQSRSAQISDLKMAEEAARQQDVTEAIDKVLFKIECAIAPESFEAETGEQLDRIKILFFGKMKYTWQGADGQSATKEESFANLIINVSSSVRTGLDLLFAPADIVLDNKPGSRYTTISKLPQVLQIMIQRGQYTKADGAYKDDSHVDIEEKIFLDQYADSDNVHLQQRREESWALKEELKTLEQQFKVLSNTLVSTYHYNSFLARY